jgi:hypothetical protein
LKERRGTAEQLLAYTNEELAMYNGAFGWVWITLGFVWGALLGMGFLNESHLGGYTSPRRRLLRLGHIAMIALGMLNILFWLAEPQLGMGSVSGSIAAAGLMAGAVFMPACCGLAGWRPVFVRLFPIPVVCLMSATCAIAVAAIRAALATQAGVLS